MKLTLAAFCLLFLVTCAACTLQAQERFAFSGAGYFDGAQTKGLAGLALPIKDSKAWSISEVTFGTVPKDKGNIQIAGKDFQGDFSSGIAYEIYNYQGFRLFGLGEPGLQQTGEISSFMLKAGGGIHKMISKQFGIAVFGTWKYAKTDYQYQWKVNPAIALTFNF
jgi:hypothetical protein